MRSRIGWLICGIFLMALPGCAAEGGERTQASKGQGLELDGACVVADPVIEHSCGHANFGPFASATAQAYPGFVFTDISATHTNYTVTLPPSGASHGGAVLYSPGQDGRYAFFTTPGVSLQLVDATGQPQSPVIGAAIPDELCAQIEQVAVFALSSSQTYTVVYGPSASATTQTLVEFIGEGSCDTCAGVDLDASRSLWPANQTNGQATLEAPITFELPETIAVLQGRARIGTATLSFRSGSAPWVHCIYTAHSGLNAFKLLACSGHLRAGDDAEADRFKLVVNPGAALFGPISLELELEDAACHAHPEGE